MFLGQIFVKNAKIPLKHFLSGQNRAEVKNRKNAEILVNSVKNGFLAFKMAKLSRFFKIATSNVAHIFIDKCSYAYNPFFLKIRQNLEKKLETTFFDD